MSTSTLRRTSSSARTAESVELTLSGSILESYVLPIDIAEFTKFSLERLDYESRGRGTDCEPADLSVSLLASCASATAPHSTNATPRATIPNDFRSRGCFSCPGPLLVRGGRLPIVGFHHSSAPICHYSILQFPNTHFIRSITSLGWTITSRASDSSSAPVDGSTSQPRLAASASRSGSFIVLA